MDEKPTQKPNEARPAVPSTDWLGRGHPPTYREFSYVVMVSGDDVELMTLLTKAMESYPEANHEAVAAWFSKKWGAP